MQAFGIGELNEKPGDKDCNIHKRLMEAEQISMRKIDK